MTGRRQALERMIQALNDELIAEGRAEGLVVAAEAVRRSIRALVQARFGRAPHVLIDRVQSTAHLDRLEEILMQVTRAERLEDIDLSRH